MFFVNNFYGLAMSQCMRTSLAAITSPWHAKGAQRRALQEIFAIVFFFFVVDIPYFDSHLHCCGVSVPGEARLRGGLRRSQNAEKLQAWAEARAAVSLIGLLAV